MSKRSRWSLASPSPRLYQGVAAAAESKRLPASANARCGSTFTPRSGRSGLREGKTRGGRGSEAAQHVVDVVAAVAEAGEAQHRRLDIEAVYHRRETEQGADRRIGMDALDLYLRRRTIVRTGESEVVDRQLERPRIEGDVAERQATAELLRDGLFGLARDDGRHVEPRRAPDQAEHNEDDACAPHATPRYEASSRRKE